MAVTHKAEGVALGPDLIFAQAETTQDEVALIQRWVAYQVEMMIASSQRVRTLPLCTDFEGRLSRSGHEVGQLNILLDGMLSSQPSQRINLNIQGPRGLVQPVLDQEKRTPRGPFAVPTDVRGCQ